MARAIAEDDEAWAPIHRPTVKQILAREEMGTPDTTTIKGREYEVIRVGTGSDHPDLHKHLLAAGWDGESYMLMGKRGAVYGAYRSATTGEFSIVINARF